MEGELDESGLTMGEIHLIKESFVDTLQGRFHVRPKYPGQRTSDKLEPVVAAKPLPATQPASSEASEPSRPPEASEPAQPAATAEVPAVEGGADDV
jgi:hypothetical protein